MMSSQPIYWLRALARLVDYPSVELYEQPNEVFSALQEMSVSLSTKVAVTDAFMALFQQPLLEIQSQYVAQFDHQRRTSLHLFEHVHGDSRERGQAMVDLVRMYLERNQFIITEELPDHLPVILEFASLLEVEEARQLVGEFAHILYHLATTLEETASAYSLVFYALMEWVGFSPATVTKRAYTESSLDAEWEEPPVFGACQTPISSQPQVVHFVPSSSSTKGVSR